MGVSGIFTVRGWCDNQMVELTALVATTTRSLCSATKMVNAGHCIEMRPTQSVSRCSGGGCVLLQRCGKRDVLSIRAKCVDFLVGTQMLGLLRWSPLRKKISTRVGTVSLRCFWTSVGRFVLCLFATTLISFLAIWQPVDMIMDAGAEEHVESLADWKSLGEPVLKPA